MIELQPTACSGLSSWLQDVEFNCLFAHSVVEGAAAGEVWVDAALDPALIHIIHSYGMSLLLVRSAQPDWAVLGSHLAACRDRFAALWLQLHPVGLAPRMDALLGAAPAASGGAFCSASVQRHARCNFVFERERYLARAAAKAASAPFQLRRMAAQDFALPGISVSPQRFWPSASAFMAAGGGWCVTDGAAVASLAFTSFRRDDQLEIGVETYPAFRGQGLAALGASALIDQCLAQGLEPIWSCRKQNQASVSLALSLGFVPAYEGPYYHLPGNHAQAGRWADRQPGARHPAGGRHAAAAEWMDINAARDRLCSGPPTERSDV